MKRFFILIIFAALTLTASAQHKKHKDNSFDFTLRAGANFSQIDGDGSGSYDHLGYHATVGTSFPLGDSGLRLAVEMGVTLKGSNVNQIHRDINLTYVEIPLLLSYDLLGNNLRLQMGVAPAILSRTNVVDGTAFNAVQAGNYKRLDVLPFVMGFEYYLGDHFGIGMRFNSSMLNIAKESSSGTYRLFKSNEGQFNRLLSASLLYRF